MSIPDIKKMTTKERLEAMELLWDSLREESVESPTWHKSVLDERRTLIESGNAEFLTFSELKKELS